MTTVHAIHIEVIVPNEHDHTAADKLGPYRVKLRERSGYLERDFASAILLR